MEAGVKITASNCARFNNALHARFHDEMCTIVDDGTVVLQEIFITEDLMAEWKGSIDMEKQISRETTVALETESLEDADVERDGFVTYVFESVRKEVNSPFPEDREAAEVLIKVVNTYNGLQKESVEEETLHIEGLLADLKKPENAAAVTTLGLDRAVEGLEASNEKYKALRLARSNKEALAKLPPTKDVRQLSDDIFERVCLLIMAGYVITTKPEVKTAVEELVMKLNKRIAELKTTHNQIMAQNHGAGSGDGSGTYPGTMPDDLTGGGSDESEGDTSDGGSSDGGSSDGGSETPDSGTEDGGTTPPDTGGGDDEDDGGSLVG